MGFDSALLCKKQQRFLPTASPGGREHAACIFGSILFVSPLPPTLLVALVESFCLLYKIAPCTGWTRGGWVTSEDNSRFHPHEGEAKITTRHQMIHHSRDRPPHLG